MGLVQCRHGYKLNSDATLGEKEGSRKTYRGAGFTFEQLLPALTATTTFRPHLKQATGNTHLRLSTVLVFLVLQGSFIFFVSIVISEAERVSE
jgi:hypothetical protein